MRVVQRVNAFVAIDLSAQYLDSCKDRLYAGLPTRSIESSIGAAASSLAYDRITCQAVVREVLRVLIQAIAPVLPFLAEDVFQHSAAAFTPALLKLQQGIPGANFDIVVPNATIFDVIFDPTLPPEWSTQPTVVAEWGNLVTLQMETNRLLEEARTAKHIGSSLEARIVLRVPTVGPLTGIARALVAEALRTPSGVRNGSASTMYEVQALIDDVGFCAVTDSGSLEAVFGVSEVQVVVFRSPDMKRHVADEGGRFQYRKAVLTDHVNGSGSLLDSLQIDVAVLPARGGKCARCWKYSAHAECHPCHVCRRCESVVTQLDAWETT